MNFVYFGWGWNIWWDILNWYCVLLLSCLDLFGILVGIGFVYVVGGFDWGNEFEDDVGNIYEIDDGISNVLDDYVVKNEVVEEDVYLKCVSGGISFVILWIYLWKLWLMKEKRNEV